MDISYLQRASGFWDVVLAIGRVLLSSVGSIITAVLTGLFEATVYVVHDQMMKPLIQELMGTFTMSTAMFHENSKDMISMLLIYCYERVRIIGFAVLMLIALWQVFKSFFAYAGYSQPEESWKIGLKLMLYGILVLYSKEICELAIGIAVEIVGILGGIDVSGNIQRRNAGNLFSGDVANNFSNLYGSWESTNYLGHILTGNVGSNMREIVTKVLDTVESLEIARDNPIGAIVQWLMIILIDMKLFNVALDMTEKYMNLVLMIIISPLAFACGVAKATNKILNKWVTFFTSCILYQVGQFILMAMVYYISCHSNANPFKLLLILWAILAMAEDLPSLIDELGFAQIGKSATAIVQVAKGLDSVTESVLKDKKDNKNTNNDSSNLPSVSVQNTSNNIQAHVNVGK